MVQIKVKRSTTGDVHSLSEHCFGADAVQLPLCRGLDRLSESVGRLCDEIDRLVDSNHRFQDEAQEEAANRLFADLRSSGVVTEDGVRLTYGSHENIEGSLYIEHGDRTIRFRWLGTGAGQHLYVNGDGNFFECRGYDIPTIRHLSDSSNRALDPFSETPWQINEAVELLEAARRGFIAERLHRTDVVLDEIARAGGSE